MSALQTWQTFLDHSLATRLDAGTFESYVKILSTQYPLPTSRISDLFLRPTEHNDVSLDPRIPRFVQVLLGQELVTAPSVLRALLRWSSYGASEGAKEGDNGHADRDKEGKGDGGQENGNAQLKGRKKDERKRWTNSYATEEILFYRLAKLISSGNAPSNTQEAVELILVCIKWMDTVFSASQTAHEMLGGLGGGHTEEMNAQTMALGTLMVAVVENGRVLRALGKGSAPKGTGKELSKTLGNFLPLILQSSPQSMARLDVFRTQTLVAIEPVDKKELAANKEIDEILDEGMGLGIESIVVGDLPTMNSRAGLYIYLNSLVSTAEVRVPTRILTTVQLVGRPLIDDNAVFAYLHNRYQVRVTCPCGVSLLKETGRHSIYNHRSYPCCFRRPRECDI
jgi:mediator of RNA polymerase II transcription subunit 5